MNAVVRNGCCEIRGGAGKPRVTLPPMNIDEAILHRDHVAVCLLYTSALPTKLEV